MTSDHYQENAICQLYFTLLHIATALQHIYISAILFPSVRAVVYHCFIAKVNCHSQWNCLSSAWNSKKWHTALFKTRMTSDNDNECSKVDNFEFLQIECDSWTLESMIFLLHNGWEGNHSCVKERGSYEI